MEVTVSPLRWLLKVDLHLSRVLAEERDFYGKCGNRQPTKGIFASTALSEETLPAASLRVGSGEGQAGMPTTGAQWRGSHTRLCTAWWS